MKNIKIENKILLIIFICFSPILLGQNATKNLTITGFVVDAKRNPVENASIFIDGVKTSSVTNKKGFYKIKTSRKAREIMVFSPFNGYSTVALDGQESIDFILSNETKDLDRKAKAVDNEIVNTGYGTAGKNDIPNKINKIDGQDQRFAAYQDIYDMLRGSVPGVEVSGKSITIRGSTSLNASTEPLFVVDGVIVNSIDNISPQSVKSIEVLKGADASVYGTRGSNGVILITLVSGRKK
ncbi:MAG: TonB-dependent receptor plug domain-containing protein [Bacteroidales bacterium]|nr:TonB-dependent receptor plug domain-containing protein [Bacteroidales bacterium]